MPQGKIVPVKLESLVGDQKVTEEPTFSAFNEGEVAPEQENKNSSQDSYEDENNSLAGAV